MHRVALVVQLSSAELAKPPITNLLRPRCTQKGVLFHKTGNASHRCGGGWEAAQWRGNKGGRGRYL